MKKHINLIELFSGIGGFTKGFIDAGYTIKNHYFSEIDKHAIANYTYNYEKSKHIGSVTDVRAKGIKRPDVITFGSPCQDFSIAGNKTGLDGKRSVLILEAIRVIKELQPSVFIWENVKGAFSSNGGSDFWAILAAFTNIGGYRLEWQLLNTSWFLPQNRERIYLVGHLTERSDPGVFPFSKNDKLFNQQERTENGRTQTKNNHSTTLTAKGNLKADATYIKAATLTAGANSGGLHSTMNLIKQINDKKNLGNSTKQQDRVYDPTGIMCCLGSNRLESKVNILAQRGGRFENDKQHLEARKDNLTNTLTSVQKDNYLFDDNKIRRLTEIECERLQGFTDDWTKYGNYNGIIKQIPKTQRYKLIGNAVTTDVVKQIATRLKIK